jgi:hypothetical protein
MSDTVRNDCLDNFETNRDQDLGKAIAEAATALSNKMQPTNPVVIKNLRRDKSNTTAQPNVNKSGLASTGGTTTTYPS